MDSSFDIGVIGAGIHGVGVAQAAAAAGYSVVVWEQTAAGSGTSSKSSKLIHGGLRYLESRQFALVKKSLDERALLLKNAPALVRAIPFYIPIYSNTKRRPWQIRIGLSLYALLGRLDRHARYRRLRNYATALVDGLQTQGLQRLYQYWDAQTDDAALTRAVLDSAIELGAEYRCPAEVSAIHYQDTAYRVTVAEQDLVKTYQCKTMVNAAGPWVNKVLSLCEPMPVELAMDLVQGTHIIVADEAPSGVYYVEAPQDGRAVFVMPWQSMTMIGTTEHAFTGDDPAEVRPMQEEIDYLLNVYQHYFPQRQAELVDSFAGLRVLPREAGHFFHRPRDTVIHHDDHLPGLLTLYGGKLTSYRATAVEVVAQLKPLLPTRTPKADTAQLSLKHLS